MKIGIDMHHGFLRDESIPVEQALRQVKAEGYQGAYYKSPVYISPTLDPGELQEAANIAQELDLYIDFGIGRVNPYNYQRNAGNLAAGRRRLQARHGEADPRGGFDGSQRIDRGNRQFQTEA
ncbi:hypothetical protein PAE9249_05338 [Paenibacillus sp. CECT 9249]|uniref:hypothetical protein n=1 Tax=Paenibacillus sp. CECT 9249 TaxID=2845385 RepID=UPI001E54750C|nr:hypothetical protein [Paenibacillus sp. CECT 9249]CAH0122747.1 hypothetical protein PAE9249_05338 [Paenibacillus sp. CECT 9249]